MLSAYFKPKRTAAASRGFLATARRSCGNYSYIERVRLLQLLRRLHFALVWSYKTAFGHVDVEPDLFLQGVSVAASPVLATIGMSVRPSVRPSHAGTE